MEWVKGNLEEIVSLRLKRKIGPKTGMFEMPEFKLEEWARMPNNRKELSAAVIKVLEHDKVNESHEYYRGLCHMLQRLSLKEVYPHAKNWFEKNYYTFREKKDIGSLAVSALSAIQSNETPKFWESIFIVSPEEWVQASFTGLMICSPLEATKNLRYLDIGIKDKLYSLLVRRLYNHLQHSNKMSSELERLYFKALLNEGIGYGEGWALRANSALSEMYLNKAI
ncbi:MAG: hypothetical protein ABIB71_08500 [Candidatus Woesearchaeota archaeon]